MRNKYFILVLTFLCIIVSQESFGQDYNDNSWDADGDVVGDPLDEVVIVNDYHDSSDDVDPNADLYDPYNYGNEPTPIEDDDPHNDAPVTNPTTSVTPEPTVCTLVGCSSAGYVVDTSLCACVPVPKTWYLDNDGDDYYSGTMFQAEKPSGNYKASTKGGDCDDTDATKNGSNCGLPLWYFDNDGDGYHGDIQDSATSPGTNWKLATMGEDCDDDDPTRTTDCVTPVWFLDNDQDSYYAEMKQVNESPGDGWIKGTPKGKDCDDTIYSKDNVCYTPLKDPCLKKSLDAILNASPSTNVFTKLFNDNFGTNLGCIITFIEYSDATKSYIDAFAKQTGSDSFDLSLNLAALDYASDEYITATIYHEMIHNYLTTIGIKDELQQHEEMQKNWQTVMAEQLKLDFPNLSDEDAKGLSWGGLGDTTGYQKLLADDKKNNTGVTGAIAASNKNFKNLNNTNTTTYGTPCK